MPGRRSVRRDYTLGACPGWLDVSTYNSDFSFDFGLALTEDIATGGCKIVGP